MVKKINASLISTGILGSALAILWIGYALTGDKSPELEVRQLDISVTPPPPPPPQSQQVIEQTELTMQVEGDGAAIEMADLKVDPDIEIEKPDMPQVKMTQTKWDMPEIDWDAYKLSDLDSKPSLLTPVKIRFPKRLERQGITKVVVKLDVMIDEKGDVTLIDIVENPYHELNREIHRFVAGSKFTSPYKGSQAVRARFIWPVVIEA
ncbi:hypothetical protein N7931_12920 [Catenovulum sp. 2E275]|uniref:hypothetical protein n=1 Tax=Catenovulum sp. 2E275 TaxID=2980497 RepID=UPI0021CFFA55|nr:hypothetical protein [Catenovulum sp. 2E275]MCU4676532.1 hypothetical protein [Catenovulum sp. 2E275]